MKIMGKFLFLLVCLTAGNSAESHYHHHHHWGAGVYWGPPLVVDPFVQPSPPVYVAPPSPPIVVEENHCKAFTRCLEDAETKKEKRRCEKKHPKCAAENQ